MRTERVANRSATDGLVCEILQEMSEPVDGCDTVNRFDDFKSEHIRECGVMELEVSHERLVSEIAFVLRCPACGESIHGSIHDSELAAVIQFLAPVVH
jgi:hypothetical protein